MKQFLDILFSRGMLVFAIFLVILNALSFKYIGNFKAWWFLLVLEIASIICYVVARNLNNPDQRIFFKDTP